LQQRHTWCKGHTQATFTRTTWQLTHTATRPHTHKIRREKRLNSDTPGVEYTQATHVATHAPRGSTHTKYTARNVKRKTEEKKKKSREKRETNIRANALQKDTNKHTIALTRLPISDTKRATNHAGQNVGDLHT